MTRLLFVCVLMLAVAAPAAHANKKRNEIIRDCADGRMDGKYSASEMRDARNNLPADVDEYTDCRDLLTRSTRSGGGSGSGDPTASGGSEPQALGPANAEEEDELRKVRLGAGDAAVEVDGEKIVPGAAGFAADVARRGLPGPLLALLILLGVAALAGAVPAVRRRVIRRDQA